MDPEKREPGGGGASIQPEGTAVKKQEDTTTKTIATRKFHANEFHAKIGHPIEERMRATANHLHYSIKGALKVYED